MKTSFLTLFLLFGFFSSHAQFGEKIRTGRPGQSIGPYTLGKKVFQLQTGATFTDIDDGAARNEKIGDYIAIVRLGLLEKLEISGVINYRNQHFDNSFLSSTLKGINNTQIGLRYNILKARGYIPAIGLQGRLLLKGQTGDFKREDVGSKFILAVGQKVTNWLSFTGNYIMTWQGDGQDPAKAYTAALSFPITKKLEAFVEMYGNLDDFTTNYDGGLGYTLTDNFKIDVSAGWQGEDEIDNYFIDFGFSWRLVWR